MTYEQRLARRIKEAMRSLEPLIHEAATTIRVYHEADRRGRPGSLTLEQKVKLLLIKQLVGESNRVFANMLDLFSMVSGMYVVPVFAVALRRAEDVSLALDARGFVMFGRKTVKTNRTDYILSEYKIKALDVAIIAILIALLVLIVMGDYYFGWFKITGSLTSFLI